MKPLLFIGNRRCGTTMMCHILNDHPYVYVPFERYIVWIMFQISEGRKLESYSGLTRKPMDMTLREAPSQIKAFRELKEYTPENLRTAFFNIAFQCMKRRHDGRRKNPRLLGEKNPEVCDPLLWKFASSFLGDAKVIHMYRHPAACVESKLAFAKKYNFANWDGDRDEMLRKWAVREYDAQNIDAHRIKYENLTLNYREEMERLCEYLDIEFLPIGRRAKTLIRPHHNDQYDLSVSDQPLLKVFMKEYGYK